MDMVEPASIPQITAYAALVASQAYMIKYFIDELRNKDKNYKESIDKMATEFKQSLQEVVNESKESFNKLAVAIDELRAKFTQR